MRSGLIPALYGGFMAQAGSTWRVALFRPGEAIRSGTWPPRSTRPTCSTRGDRRPRIASLVEATLRRSALGLVEAMKQAHIPAG